MSSVKQISDERKYLNKTLWMQCAKQVKNYEDDVAIRWKREGACLAVTQRTRTVATAEYDELTIEELRSAIEFMKVGPGILDQLSLIVDDHKSKYATKYQLKKLHYLAQACGVYHAPVNVVIVVGDFNLTGQELRREMIGTFERGRLQGAISKHIYTKWINPKIHEMLKQSGLRYQISDAKAKYFVKYDEITREEANELIKRFQKNYNELTERYGAQSATATHFSNN